jgi:hypothetical protein
MKRSGYDLRVALKQSIPVFHYEKDYLWLQKGNCEGKSGVRFEECSQLAPHQYFYLIPHLMKIKGSGNEGINAWKGLKARLGMRQGEDDQTAP